MTQTMTYQCPHCGQPMEVATESGQEILTCPNAECRKPFHVELPTAQLAPALIVPGSYRTDDEPPAPAQTELSPTPVAAPAAAAETELVQVKPVMFRRFPLRYIGYSLLTAGGAVVLLIALLRGMPIVGILAVAAAVYGAYRLLAWWLRVNSTTLTVTTRRTVLRTGLVNTATIEIPHAEVTDVQVKQNVLNQMLRVGDLTVTGNGTDKKSIVVLAVPDVETVATQIRNFRPA